MIIVVRREKEREKGDGGAVMAFYVMVPRGSIFFCLAYVQVVGKNCTPERELCVDASVLLNTDDTRIW